MRKPDDTRVVKWHGFDVTVDIWCDPTDMPWDGDCELEEGAEGWDLLVRVTLSTFTAQDSLGSCWGDREYISETLDTEVIPQALLNLEHEIKSIAHGRDVKAAELRLDVAQSVCYDAFGEEW